MFWGAEGKGSFLLTNQHTKVRCELDESQHLASTDERDENLSRKKKKDRRRRREEDKGNNIPARAIHDGATPCPFIMAVVR